MDSFEISRCLQVEQGEMWEKLKVDGTWFHVMRSFAQDGEIARIGVMALAVYIVIKGHTEFGTGNAFPSIARIAKQIGVSEDTVALAQKVLVKHGWLKVNRSGRRNVYSVIEKVKIKDQSGLHLGDAQRKYIGDEFKGFIDELNRLAKSGNLPTDKSIVINLTINVNSNNITQGDNGVVTNGNNRVTNIVINTSKELRAALQKL